MALACRALMLDNVGEFVFGEIPTALQALQDSSFSSPYLLASYEWMNWSGTWPRRNFPRLLTVCQSLLPDRVYQAILPGDRAMFDFFSVSVSNTLCHASTDTKHKSSFQLLQDSIESRVAASKRTSDCFLNRFPVDCPLDYLTLECSATILGGIVDASNILQYGLFHLCADQVLQQQLFQEIDSVWSAEVSDIPETTVLSTLPLLVSQTRIENSCHETEADSFDRQEFLWRASASRTDALVDHHVWHHLKAQCSEE